MKAMILAAGLGTRMRPLTLTTPKPLLEVGGKPLIVWHIEALKQAGITDIVINAAYLADKLQHALGDGSTWGVNIHWSIETEALETAGGIVQALPMLGSDPFILINGDVWTRIGLQVLIAKAQTMPADAAAFLCLIDNPSHHPEGDFYLQNGQVLWQAQPAVAVRYTFAGLSVLRPQLFAPMQPGKAPLAPILRQAMDNQQVQGEHFSDAWVDVGTIERLQWLDAQIQAGTI